MFGWCSGLENLFCSLSPKIVICTNIVRYAAVVLSKINSVFVGFGFIGFDGSHGLLENWAEKGSGSLLIRLD
jgi:hypothetical protein